MTMTTNEMLVKLTSSKNQIIADKSVDILLGIKTIDEEKKYCGSFFKAVLEGDYEEALRRADSDNRQALTS
jgi:hypothetical protein